MKYFNKKSKYVMVGFLTFMTGSALAVTLDTVTAPSKFPSDIPTSDYQLNEAEATKKLDNLVWQRCLVGQTFKGGECTGSATEFDSWEKALNNSVTAEQAANGWRVPNIKELMRITDSTKAFPATNTEVFSFAKSLRYSFDTSGYWATTSSPTSPMIWSATPISHETITDVNWTHISETESIAKTEEKRLEANKVYALSLDYGNHKYAYRDGRSKGEVEGNGDKDNVIKARHVLLVKDAS